eukprot:GFKZ01010866.1.p1 GENE.GFKZ01010866.1~~GFKZ01010866.1.p1  ORF type:complete len:349 (-),score=47.59 GFKZ01010866.1:311-1357(-)
MPSETNQLNSDLLYQHSLTPQKWTACNPTEPAEWLSSASRITGSHSPRPNPRTKTTNPETDLLVAARWQTQLLIGAGSFGDVYQALDTTTGQGVAIKVEQASPHNLTLRNELAVYKALAADAYPPGFAKMLHFEHLRDDKCALVLQRLGRSLEDIRAAQPDACLPVQQVVQVGVQCLDALERLHGLGFIHCDVKPENILAGVGVHHDRYFLVDFGLAVRITDCNRHQVEVEAGKGQGFVGTTLYASVNVHDGGAVSKRCDVESLAYSLAELVSGRLPWSESDGHKMSKRKMRRVMAQRKREASAEQLFRGWGEGFEDFFEQVQALGYDECPNYEQLRRHLLREQNQST